jgi:co-chaperonin GroES (HSP10)
MSVFEAHVVNSVKPLHDSVVVKDMNFDERLTRSGLVIVRDDGKNSGIRPRWAEVYAVGPDQTEIKVGQWICVAHGRWTRGIKIVDSTGEHTIRRVDNNDILLVSDEPVEDLTMSDKVI